MLLRTSLLAGALCASLGASSKADQIASSVLAAPEKSRAGAAVLGWAADGDVVSLREGTNELICLADKPGDKNFSVACYHKDLEPFMARGRELSKEGVKGKERHEIRWKDVDEGRVKMPREARMLYVMTGSRFDSEEGEIIDPYLRWVVYTPYATPESTGLTVEPGNAPWLMYPGKAGAHIMINPPK